MPATSLRSVIEKSQSLIYVKDLDGRYLMANEPFERAFSVTEEELLGKSDTYLGPKLAPVWTVNDLHAQQGECRVEEWSDGEHGRRYYESVKLPLLSARLSAAMLMPLASVCAARMVYVNTSAVPPEPEA